MVIKHPLVSSLVGGQAEEPQRRFLPWWAPHKYYPPFYNCKLLHNIVKFTRYVWQGGRHHNFAKKKKNSTWHTLKIKKSFCKVQKMSIITIAAWWRWQNYRSSILINSYFTSGNINIIIFTCFHIVWNKYPYPPHHGYWKFQGGEEYSMKLIWNFLRGGGSNQKTFCGGHVDIFSSNTFHA